MRAFAIYRHGILRNTYTVYAFIDVFNNHFFQTRTIYNVVKTNNDYTLSYETYNTQAFHVLCIIWTTCIHIEQNINVI